MAIVLLSIPCKLLALEELTPTARGGNSKMMSPSYMEGRKSTVLYGTEA